MTENNRFKIKNDQAAAELFEKVIEWHENGENYGDNHTATDRYHRTLMSLRGYIRRRETDSRKITSGLLHACFRWMNLKDDVDARVEHNPAREEGLTPCPVAVAVPVNDMERIIHTVNRFDHSIAGFDHVDSDRVRVAIRRGRCMKDVPDWIDYDGPAEGSA